MKRTLAAVSTLFFCAAPAVAGEPSAVAAVPHGLDTVWVVLLAAFLVFFMQAGFGTIAAGFIRARNTYNALIKNFLDYAGDKGARTANPTPAEGHVD